MHTTRVQYIRSYRQPYVKTAKSKKLKCMYVCRARMSYPADSMHRNIILCIRHTCCIHATSGLLYAHLTDCTTLIQEYILYYY